MAEQGSLEWKQMRLGKVTASRVADVIAKTKSGYSTSRANYMTELVIEMFGVIGEGFTNSAMQWGTETEPLARSMYEIKNNFVEVEETDFIQHPIINQAGMSPDGLVGEDGLIEIKCPNSTTHFEYIINNEVPAKYKPQMAWQMACSGRKWCDFVSYDPRCPEGLKYFQIRYERDNEYIAMLENEVIEFLKELEIKHEILKLKMKELVK